MCFSATGSFAVSGILTAVGAASLARNSSPPHRMFAAIPLIFAVQQLAEGTVWVTMDGTHPLLNRMAVSLFVGIALLVWPTWMPLALWRAEREPTRRRALGALVGAGAVVAAYASVFLARFPPVADIVGHSIRYRYTTTGDRTLLFYLVAYALPSVVPFFVSTTRLARTIGVMLVVSLVTSVVVQRDALTSVWCFFAAMLSAVILLAVERDHQAALETRPTGAV